MTKTPHDVLEALDRVDRQAELAKRDPNGRYCSLRELGIFVEPPKPPEPGKPPEASTPWNKSYWMPGEWFDWETRAKAVQAAQFEQEKQYRPDEAEKDSAISGITSRPIIRRS